MAFRDDIAGDAAIADGFEAVTVALKGTATQPSRSVANALRRQVTDDEDQLEAVYVGQDLTVWNIPETQMTSGDQMNPGDTVTAGTEVWTVLDVRYQTLRTRFRCVCTLNR